MCHSTKEPIFITKNGYGDMVLMSMENYERMMKLSKVYKELEESESQIEAGQTMNARKQLASMREKYSCRKDMKRQFINTLIISLLVNKVG